MTKLCADDAVCAFSLTGEQLLYKDFYLRLAGLQLALAQRAIPGQRVALYCLDSVHFALGLRALNSHNCQLILLPNGLPETLQQFQGEFDWFLTDDPSLAAHTHHPLLDIRLYSKPSTASAPNLNWLNSAITLFTSGSSGQPKRVDKNFQQLQQEAEMLEAFFAADAPEAHMVATVSHQHIYGVLFRVLWPLLSGRAFCRDLIEFQEQLRGLKQPALLISSPAFLRHLLAGDGQIEQLKMAFSSGGPLSAEVALQASIILGVPVTEVLGSTETGGIAHRQQNTAQTPWRPLPGVEISVTPTQTLKVNSPYAGGEQIVEDRVELLDDGSFRHLGRSDRVVKIAEKRLSLIELEVYLEQLDWIAEVAALVIKKGNRDHVALILALQPEAAERLASQGRAFINQRVKAHLMQRYEPVLLPRYFRYVERLPVNAQGKRVYQDLRALFDS